MSKLSSDIKKDRYCSSCCGNAGEQWEQERWLHRQKQVCRFIKYRWAKKYTNNQKGKQMEASVKIPKVKITGTDGKVMKSRK